MRSAVPLSLAAVLSLGLAPAARALPVGPGQTVTVSSTTPAPADLIDTISASQGVVVPFAGPITFQELSVTLVTNVYRNANGTLAFQYNLSSVNFPPPSPGPPFPEASLPSLSVDQFGTFTTDAQAQVIPNDAPTGPLATPVLQVSRSASSDGLTYTFSTDASHLIFRDNTLMPNALASVLIQTDATHYFPSDASVDVHTFDGRDPGGYTDNVLSFGSFSPTAAIGDPAPPVPEPLSLLTLPLGVAALVLRQRRAGAR
jgi:hypothetical protein